MAAAAEINFNPWDPAFRANPYPFYKQLVAGPPRLIDLFGPTALIARFADVTAVLKDQQRFSSTQLRSPDMVAKGPAEGPFAGATTMLFADPPVHTRLRRHAPGADLISALVAAHDDGEALTAEELLAFAVLLLLAGNETTTNLIGNGMLALGRNPEQMDLLRQRPELMPRAIEETLRFDGPVQSTIRFTIENMNHGGTALPAGICFFLILSPATLA